MNKGEAGLNALREIFGQERWDRMVAERIWWQR